MMAKRDWKALQQEYKLAFEQTGITIKAWCDQNQINYNTARRYLQVLNSPLENSENSAKNVQSPRAITSSPDVERLAQCDQLGEGREEKVSKSKGKGEKASVISESDQFTDHITDQHSPKPTHAQFLQRVLHLDTTHQRDESGRFIHGNQCSTKHNGYAQRLNDPDAIFDAANSDIDHEIVFCRARVLKAMETYQKIGAELGKEGLALAERVKLYELYVSTDNIVDRNMARVESLLRTKAQVKKTELEAERIAQESAGLGTAIADIVQEIQEMGSDGFVLND
ncbi:TPA: hypothetical protein ACMDNS_003135 [Vibrio cholerae]